MQKNTAIKKTSKTEAYTTKGKKASISKTKGLEQTLLYLEENRSQLKSLNRGLMSDADCVDTIDNTPLSAKVKSALKKILEITAPVGGKIYALGRMIVSILLKITKAVAKRYPNTAFGVILGLSLGAMLNFIPFIGSFISPFVSILLAVVGGVTGFIKDVSLSDVRIDINREVLRNGYYSA